MKIVVNKFPLVIIILGLISLGILLNAVLEHKNIKEYEETINSQEALITSYKEYKEACETLLDSIYKYNDSITDSDTYVDYLEKRAALHE